MVDTQNERPAPSGTGPWFRAYGLFLLLQYHPAQRRAFQGVHLEQICAMCDISWQMYDKLASIGCCCVDFSAYHDCQ
jgi:hypothetical protein